MPTGLSQAVVALLRGNAPSRMRGVHHQHIHLLARAVQLLDLVVDRRVVLINEHG